MAPRQHRKGTVPLTFSLLKEKVRPKEKCLSSRKVILKKSVYLSGGVLLLGRTYLKLKREDTKHHFVSSLCHVRRMDEVHSLGATHKSSVL